MKLKSLLSLLILIFTMSGTFIFGQTQYHYQDNWGQAGLTVISQSSEGIELVYSVSDFSLEPVSINGKMMSSIGLKGIFLPNNAGAPNVPGVSNYIAIPQSATASIEILDMRTETIQDVDLGPAPRIPKETEDGLEYPVNEEIYSNNAFYPSQPALISTPSKMRGVDVVMLGISPFQYNPVTKELTVYKDLRIKVHFSGGNGHFGEDRLRSRWTDPMLSDLILNYDQLGKVNYNKSNVNTDDVGYEYLIIVPNDAYFSVWADSIKKFRTEQGILTGIKTLNEVGGSSTTVIESYIDNAYNTWTIPPVAILLIGDYGSDPANTMNSPIWDGYCVSDNILGDVDGDDLPDIVMARMTAQNEQQLQLMVRKFIDYERNPPTSADFYAHPITALGWQTERWFQLCSSVIGGFWQNALGKTPVRINAVYIGDPSVDPWSTATNTTDVVNFFGPTGLGYIPATPQGLSGWTGGNASQVNDALNEGSFMLQHRDHGGEDGWGEPAYLNGDIDGLTNTDLSYIMSVNCLTGKYNSPMEVFAEKFHRYTYNGQPSGALGILAASETSYSFVNDAYIWGVYDNMWPEFMPTFSSTPAERGILPAFGNAAGKFFLEQSSWPYNTTEKEVTYNLFHHHGDAFLTVYSEVPQLLTVVHNPTIFIGETSFTVTANTGSLICLSLNGEILGTGTGTGGPVSINIPGTQLPPDQIKVVVNLQNYYRYEGYVSVIPPTGPYVVKESYNLVDNTGNNNGLMDYGENNTLDFTVKNVGVIQADNVTSTLSTTDTYVTILTNTASFGNIAAGQTSTLPGAFSWTVANDIPDNHQVNFSVSSTNGTDVWMSYFSIKGHAPTIGYKQFTISDPTGNNNGKIDPGETVSLIVTIKNTGSSAASNISGLLSSTDPFITVNSTSQGFGDANPGAMVAATFSITADGLTPAGHMAAFDIQLTADLGITGSGSFNAVIGQVPVLIVDLDPDHNSGTSMQTTIQNLGIASNYVTSFPTDLGTYSSIFVCLGIYSTNAVLSSSDGQSLATYLDNGGRLYMEGGDTWKYDPQTPVHSYFNILGETDGSGDLSTLNGQASTFTEGMSFSYNGGNSYIDHISPMSGTNAFRIFQNQSPAYGSGVAYDGDTYKTVGCSHEFGGLIDGALPSTRENLMFEYLTFFGIIPQALAANFNAQATQVCEGGIITFHDLSDGIPISWNWSFPGGTPSSSTDQNPQVTYQVSGNYDVTLIVSDGVDYDTLTQTNYITVSVLPLAANTPSGPAIVCNNAAATTYTTVPLSGALSYVWTLLPSAAGTVTGTTQNAVVFFNSSYTGPATLIVNAVNICGQGPASSPWTINVMAAPTVTLQNFSNVCVYWPSFTLSGGSPAGGTYSGTGVSGGMFNPAQAALGYNYITYNYSDPNNCSSSATKTIYVDACSGIADNPGMTMNAEVYPNPGTTDFHVHVWGLLGKKTVMSVKNILGQDVYTVSEEVSLGEKIWNIDCSGWSTGIYYLIIENQGKKINRKILVE